VAVRRTANFGWWTMTANGMDVFLVKLDAGGEVQCTGMVEPSVSREVVAVMAMARSFGGENFRFGRFRRRGDRLHGASDAFVRSSRRTANILSRGFGATGSGILAMDPAATTGWRCRSSTAAPSTWGTDSVNRADRYSVAGSG
jgi:hypothetical protein